MRAFLLDGDPRNIRRGGAETNASIKECTVVDFVPLVRIQRSSYITLADQAFSNLEVMLSKIGTFNPALSCAGFLFL